MPANSRADLDAVVVGAGPNGLAAAITLARAGRSVRLIEAGATIGGGARSEELTLPGFVHDVCSAIHPLGVASPFFRELPLTDFGLEWIQPPIAAAHPFDDGTAAVLAGSVADTAATLGDDEGPYRRLLEPLARDWPVLVPELLAPLRIPRRPIRMARFGFQALRSARGLAESAFRERNARGLFAGMAAHATLPLEQTASAAVGLVLMLAGHAAGWPLPRGGTQRLSDALAAYFRSLGGEIEVGRPITSLNELPPARSYLLNVTPSQLQRIAGDELPAGYHARLARYRHGPGVFKVDWALSRPIPWRAAACTRAGTVHLGGTLDQVAAAESAVWRGAHPERPFVLLAQPSLFDPSRSPPGQHTAWAYCHVPNGSRKNMLEQIEAQVERFAPGFREVVLARHTMDTHEMERRNPNYVGGDIGGGSQELRQVVFRPTVSLRSYATPNPRIFLCSSSTPPGGGVHGMCGFHAARMVIRRVGT